MRRQFALLATLALVAAVPAQAQYSIFKPVPHAKMRDLSTDRPDRTESPYTVDAGHIQVEMDGINYIRDRVDASTVVHGWAIAPVNFKVGVTPRFDLQFVSEFITGSRVATPSGNFSEHGVGEMTLRAKLNFWGNDGGTTAFGIMPFVSSSPFADGRRVQGGVILPLSVELAPNWGLGTMVETDFVAEEGRAGRSVHTVFSVTVGHDFSDRLGMFGEIFSESSKGPWVGTADFGTTFAITPNVQIDGGANIGISRAADGVNPFLGLSIRF
ncbi:MAG: transporter [Gemmatimonadota bacterium]